jgi:hypothetical protein
MGRYVGLPAVFRKAMAKFEARAVEYYPAVRLMHITERVMVFNIFLLSLFSYLLQFYSFPYEAGGGAQLPAVEAAATRLIINFNKAYPYCLLIQPLVRFGTGSPVRDTWAVGISNLASQADLTEWDGATLVQETTHFHNSMRMSTHARAAAKDFVFIFLATCETEGVAPIFVADRFVRPKKVTTRKLILEYLIRHEYSSQQDLAIAKALGRRRLPSNQAAVDFLHSNFALASSRLPPRCRRTVFQMVTNSLPTRRRTMVLLLPDKAQRDAASKPLCYFCRKGIDEAEHIYGGCEVIVRARADFSRKISIPLDPTALLGGLSLRYLTSGAGPDVASVEVVGVRSSPPPYVEPPPPYM